MSRYYLLPIGVIKAPAIAGWIAGLGPTFLNFLFLLLPVCPLKLAKLTPDGPPVIYCFVALDIYSLMSLSFQVG